MASGQLSTRSSRGVACLALTAAATAATLGAAAPGSAGSPDASAAPSASRSAEVQSPLAGWPAGAGRQRPGRSAAELARQDALAERAEREAASEPAAVPSFTPDPDDFPEPAPAGRRALDGATVHRVKQMSLGAGIALVGAGVGFLALRMRRAR
ncbi:MULTISPECIES: hypothetical protein [unclassified Streptomyces]|uniref:hypothetical protein n=1 Tax=unclassified Streptomyces TaxID=2593676 RepID=UPI001F545A06|nr:MULTISPECIES: hypothetical protein [unclassified Streptomyces]